MSAPDIITQVQSLERRGDVVRVKVAAAGPIKLESGMKNRARARALLASGVLPTTFDTLMDIPMGKINRLTNVVDSRSGGDVEFDRLSLLGKLLRKRVYTVEVNRE